MNMDVIKYVDNKFVYLDFMFETCFKLGCNMLAMYFIYYVCSSFRD